MSKGLGQKIAIKFTEDLVGNVSGKPDPIRGLGWTRNEFEKAINTTPRTNGWRFSPIQDIEVTALMIFSDVSTAVTMHLWRVPDQAKLTQITFMSKAGEWASGELPVPIRLIANIEYVVTSNTPINDGYMYSDTLTPDKRGDFSPHITMIDAYRVDSQNTFPTVRLTGPYTNSVGFAYKIEQGVGNEVAFTVTGKEYQYVNGPLIDKEYRVEKVERYPIAKLWRDDFSGQMDGVEVGENGLRLEWSEDTDYSTPEGYDIALVTMDKTHRAAMYIRDVLVAKGHTVTLYNTAEITASNLGGYDAIVCTRKAGDATTDGYLRGYIDAGIPVWVGIVQGAAGDYTDSPVCNLGMVGRVSVQSDRNGSYILDSGSPIVSPFDTPEQISTYSETTWMEVAYRADGYAGTPIANYSSGDNSITVLAIEEGTNDLFGNPYGARCGFVGWMYSLTTITLTANAQTILDRCIRWSLAARVYSESGTYTPPPIDTETLPPDPRIRFDTVTPEGTSITVEYACTDDDETPPETWMSVDDEDLLTIDDAYLWLRYTLETEDTSKTPTLLAVWLEEPEAPADQIRLVMHPQGRFNNVEGPLTVQYDQTVGSLRGRGGPVAGFTETFTPTDLEPKPNPGIAENIEVSAEASVDFIKVTYNQAYADEQITVSASATADFIYVGIINP